MVKIAHISDLHLWKVTFSFSQFLSKRWLGNMNLIFFRKKRFSKEQVFLLPDLFERLKINYVIVTGDISSTSLDDEFIFGKIIFDELKKRGIKSLFLPGNHDCYTKKAQKQKTFYKYFNNELGKSKIEKKYNLKEDGIEAHRVDGKWWVLGIDCALATHLVSSRGLFSEEVEKKLLEILELIPKDNNIILANHFPFRMANSPRKALKRANVLKKILISHPNIKLFLHGHTHHHNIFDLRKKGQPIVLDSGSAAHNLVGKWNLLELDSTSCKVKVFDWIKKEGSWHKTEEKNYNLKKIHE